MADWYDILMSYVHLPALEARPHNSLITVITNDPLMETHGCNNNVFQLNPLKEKTTPLQKPFSFIRRKKKKGEERTAGDSKV